MKKQLCGEEAARAQKEEISIYDLINGEIAQAPAGANGLYYLPYLIGERSPRWNPNAKGAFIGLTMEHTHRDMLRSVVEGVGMNLRLILDIIRTHTEVKEIIALGGLAKSDVCLQIFSGYFRDSRAKPLNHLEEATSSRSGGMRRRRRRRAQFVEEVSKFVRPVGEFEPEAEHSALYEKMLPVFDHSYHALCGVYDEIAGIAGIRNYNKRNRAAAAPEFAYKILPRCGRMFFKLAAVLLRAGRPCPRIADQERAA